MSDIIVRSTIENCSLVESTTGRSTASFLHVHVLCFAKFLTLTDYYAEQANNSLVFSGHVICQNQSTGLTFNDSFMLLVKFCNKTKELKRFETKFKVILASEDWLKLTSCVKIDFGRGSEI